MGKRSDFDRLERDFYSTPPEAVGPLIQHLDWIGPPLTFSEPCAGDGRLVETLQGYGLICVQCSDIHPQAEMAEIDCLDLEAIELANADLIITNPPWRFTFLQCFLDRCSDIWRRPAWLLLSGDFAHNKQSAPYMEHCERILPIGRVKWIPDSPHAGKDNCAWYLFNPMPVAQTVFFPRQA